MAAARGVRAIPLPLYRRWYPPDVIEDACRSALESCQPDGIHLVNGSPRSCFALRSAAAGLGIAFAITEQQVSQEVQLTPAQRAEIRESYARAIAVVFVTSGNLDTMAEAVSLAGVSCVVINNGVELGAVRPHRRLRPRPRVPARIISVGRLAPEKSLPTLIAAMSLLPADLCELDIYGDGPAGAEIEDQIASLGLGERVSLKGWTANVLPLLHQYDLFVLPSVAEGMSYALLEAMAIGLPVVGTDVPGTVEALAGGEAGLIVPRSDPVALASGIRDCLGDRDRTEARARIAVARIAQHYEQQALMDRTVRLWERFSMQEKGRECIGSW